jgi:uncharacterized glyoxalase superfamily protein PhnB
MRSNRSVPASAVIPVLAYVEVPAASDWLCRAFGFRERLRIGDHRAQLVYGDGAVILTELHSEPATASVHVRVDDAAAHHEHARSHGAQIADGPADYPYGERQYTAVDLGGHRWTFSESIADVDPLSWGATRVDAEHVPMRRIKANIKTSRRLDGGSQGAEAPALPAPERKSDRLEESRAFYVDVLGLVGGEGLDWIRFFSAPNDPQLQLSVMSLDASAGIHPAVTIEVDDVDEVHARAVESGAEIVHPLTDEPWRVRRFFVKDPNGAVINVMKHL